MLLEAVELHARVVVDKDVTLLGHGEHHLIVQVSSQSATDPCDGGGGEKCNTNFLLNLGTFNLLNISNRFSNMKFTSQLFCSPIECGNMPPMPTH